MIDSPTYRALRTLLPLALGMMAGAVVVGVLMAMS